MITNNSKLFFISVFTYCFCLLSTAEAQISDSTNIEALKNDSAACDQIFVSVEDMPMFPGGEIKLKEYISTNKVYPEIEKKNNIKGKVYVFFVINKQGNVSNVRLARGVKGHPAFDEEALRLVKAMPKWKEGRQNNNPACVDTYLIISFD